MGEDAPEAYTLFLQPLLDVHLGSTEITHDYRNWKKFDGTYIRVFALLPLNQTANAQYQTLKTELLASPHVLDVTGSGQRLGNSIHQWGLRIQDDEGVRRLSPSHLSVDYNYLAFYDLELLAGRAFNETRGTDQGQAYLVNEAFAADVGWTNPVLIRIETRAGHGAGTPTWMRIENLADQWAFLVDALGMTI